MDRKSKGKEAEELAAQWLSDHGHEVIERNYRHRRAEIDIISIWKETLLVFTEVKSRNTDQFGHAEEFASGEQRARIIEAADEYVHAINWQGDIRFDIITIRGTDRSSLQHFPDAFY